MYIHVLLILDIINKYNQNIRIFAIISYIISLMKEKINGLFSLKHILDNPFMKN
ncbi:unknown [Tannerella sp. CAG:118]|uniref:Uncharacterized protein n=1 Tax=Coprobacter secundus subsp. similis TaxID=2751153 RepID=A0A7G1HVV8_9BACT|nr:hypothetical protein Cop2CBH44_21820 [Coprobacter secundus subsp. similis]CCY39280.1 unknown [Tannerella sp. CAG:118]